MKTILFCGAFALVHVLLPTPLAAAEGKSSRASGATDLFAQPKVHRIQVEISDSAVEALRKEPRHYVKGTVREGEQVYRDIGIRLKGGSTFQAIDKKPSFSIKFNEFVKDQDFHGRSRIHLNNAHLDPSFLCEAIGGGLFYPVTVRGGEPDFTGGAMKGDN